MSELAERSRETTEALDWAQAAGKHAEMHLVRNAALLAVGAVVEHVGLDEQASFEEATSYKPARKLRDLARRPQLSVQRGCGDRLRATKLIPLGALDVPENPDLPYEFARIEEEGDFNFVEESLRFSKTPKTHEDTYYRPEIVVRRFAGSTIASPRITDEVTGSEVRMMSHPLLDVRMMQQWSPEGMVRHYQGQIDQLATFMDEVGYLGNTAGAYIHSSTHLTHYLEEDLR